MSVAEVHQELQDVKKIRVSVPHVNPLEHKPEEEEKPKKEVSTTVKAEEEPHQESSQASSDLDDISVSSLAHAVKSLDQK